MIVEDAVFGRKLGILDDRRDVESRLDSLNVKKTITLEDLLKSLVQNNSSQV